MKELSDAINSNEVLTCYMKSTTFRLKTSIEKRFGLADISLKFTTEF